MTFGQRFTLIFVIALVILFSLAWCGYDRWQTVEQNGYTVASAESTPVFVPSPYDEKLAELDKLAVEEAYVDQIKHLFAIWMKDDTGQPGRAVTGARQARKAFIGAMTEIEKRSRK